MTSSNAEGQRHSAAMTEGRGRNPREQACGADVVTARMGFSWPKAMDVMEAVVERENMRAAAKRVRSMLMTRSSQQACTARKRCASINSGKVKNH